MDLVESSQKVKTGLEITVITKRTETKLLSPKGRGLMFFPFTCLKTKPASKTEICFSMKKTPWFSSSKTGQFWQATFTITTEPGRVRAARSHAGPLGEWSLFYPGWSPVPSVWQCNNLPGLRTRTQVWNHSPFTVTTNTFSKVIFKISFILTTKLRGEAVRFPSIPSLHTCTARKFFSFYLVHCLGITTL